VGIFFWSLSVQKLDSPRLLYNSTRGCDIVNKIDSTRQTELLQILQQRFEKNQKRHPGITWFHVLESIHKQPALLWTIDQMEITGGEPDVVVFDDKEQHIYIVDCSKESPSGRRSLCYDQEALNARKEFKPVDSAMNMASNMGVTLLNEDQYLKLQALGDFDTKTSSWLITPKAIRDLDGAIFGDKRYNHTFFYHNGVQSYYKDRGFRGYIVL
jgi:hypothetical protein